MGAGFIVDHNNEDERLFDRGKEIMALLIRAHKLGYTLTLGPDQMKNSMESTDACHQA